MPTISLKLDDDTLRKLTEAALAAGVTPERMAEMMLAASIPREDGMLVLPGVSEPVRVWPGVTDEGGGPEQSASPDEGSSEDNAADHGLNETGRPWSEVRPEFMALIDKTFGKAE